jgi:hypothetical protein
MHFAFFFIHTNRLLSYCENLLFKEFLNNRLLSYSFLYEVKYFKPKKILNRNAKVFYAYISVDEFLCKIN